MLGCFSMELPRMLVLAPEDAGGPHATTTVTLDCHAFGNRICLSGIPVDLGEIELMRFFGKYGATQTTVAHARGQGFASVQFTDMNDVARLLASGLHCFTEQTTTLLAKLQGRTGSSTVTLPAMPEPSLMQGEPGTLVICWSPLTLAAAYQVELRAAGANSWSAVDACGRVQPSGTSPLIAPHTTCLAITGLSVGLPYEARIAYVSSCGCHSEISLPSIPCAPCLVPAPSPIHLQQLQQQFGAPMPMVCSPCAHMSCSLSAPQLPANLQPPVALVHPCSPCAPVQVNGNLQLQACSPLAQNPQTPCSQNVPLQLQQPCPCCPHGTPLPHTPPPQVHLADETGASLTVRWQGMGPPVAGYVVELLLNGSSAVERYTRP